MQNNRYQWGYVTRTVLYLCTVLCFALSMILFAYMNMRASALCILRGFCASMLSCLAFHVLACCAGSLAACMIAYILLYMHRLPTSSGSAVTHSARLPKRHHAEVNFDTFFLFRCCCFTSAFIMPCSGSHTDSLCTLFLMYESSNVWLVAVLFFGRCLCTACKRVFPVVVVSW